jgi:alpha-N-acetylglucosaminidase
MVNPIDPLFQTIGQAYVRQVTELFGTNHFYSADVFNEMAPKSSDPTYLANINAAIFNSITSVDENASL